MKIAVDFDGTVVDHNFPRVGKDVPYAVETLKMLVDNGHIIFLHTMRSGDYLRDAVKWFKDRDIKIAAVGVDPEQHEWTTSPKCYAEMYIDDLAFGCPTIQVPGFERVCVDWQVIKEYFEGVVDA